MNTESLVWTSPSPPQYPSDLFPFDDLRNIDVTASTHRALPRFHFAFVNPFISTLQAYPLCHASSLPSNLGICLETLNIFHHNGTFAILEKLPRLEPSSSTRLVCRFNLNFFRYEGYLFAAFRASTIMSLDYLVWGFQFYAFVEDKTTFFTNYLLWQDLTAVAERNTTDTNYLYIATESQILLQYLRFFDYLKSYSNCL